MNRKRGRPKKENPRTIGIGVSMNAIVLEQIDARAKAKGVSRSQWVWDAIMIALK